MVLTLCGLLLAGSPVWAREFIADRLTKMNGRIGKAVVYYRADTAVFPNIHWAGTVLPAVSVVPSAGSMILKARAGSMLSSMAVNLSADAGPRA